MSRQSAEESASEASEQVLEFEAEARRFEEVLLDLSVLNREELRNVLATIAEVAANALGVERVSLWQYDRERSVMVCPAAWLRGALIDETLVISRAVHPNYWGALHASRTLPVTDASQDPALADIRDVYIVPHGIGAMLDSSVRLEQATFGIVCMESLGGPRQWTALEEQFVASLADRMGLAILVDAQRRLQLQLRQAQKMEALGVMAGGIAHDFNNVLNVVLTAAGAARVLAARKQDVTPDLDAIEGAVQRAAALTRKLLFISRHETVDRETFDLNDALREFEGTARRIITPSIRLQLLPSSQPLTLSADRTFVDQALLNLCTNAMHAMPDGGSLTIATRLLEVDGARQTYGMSVPAGTYAHLRVLDTGVGIAAAALPRIFDPFFTTRGAAGTGLGLSVVYGGMRQHGGFVSVESVVGRGSVFHLLFRVA